MPASVQDKYARLWDFLQRWREWGARGTALSNALEQQYRNVFERANFQFDDPAAQMAANLGLQR